MPRSSPKLRRAHPSYPQTSHQTPPPRGSRKPLSSITLVRKSLIMFFVELKLNPTQTIAHPSLCAFILPVFTKRKSRNVHSWPGLRRPAQGLHLPFLPETATLEESLVPCQRSVTGLPRVDYTPNSNSSLSKAPHPSKQSPCLLTVGVAS